jgi:hypothetical protein
MGVKVFAEQGTFKLVGDERGFTLPFDKRHAYYAWCVDNDIETSYQGTLNNMDLWYVKNQNDRALALLTWS